MRRVEQRCIPNIEAIFLQQDINSKMRLILVDWLIDVHAKFRMRGETLFLCVNLVDRMLSAHQVDRKQLQLVGCSAFFIASKFNEIYNVQLSDLVGLTDNSYTVKQMLVMEMQILHSLDFELNFPTVFTFLEAYLAALIC
jgi:G2/mitotic-specific cyclin-B, other